MNKLKYPADSQVKVISLDLFDTLLLRGYKPEVARFNELAKELSRRLQRLGVDKNAEQVFISRLVAHRMHYRLNRIFKRTNVAAISAIVATQLSLLGVDASLAELFRTTELDCEDSGLKLNTQLVEFCAHHRYRGTKIIITSDMYLDSSSIAGLIRKKIHDKFYDEIYVSSEYNSTKEEGELFRIILTNENIRAENLLHIGDNFHSDYRVPNTMGIKSYWLPRTTFYRTLYQIINGISQVYYNRKYLF